MMNAAYFVQNAGIDMRRSTGTPLHIQGVLRAMRSVTARTTLVGLSQRELYCYDVPPGLALSRDFVPTSVPTWVGTISPLERGIRRLQSSLNAPYFGIFDLMRLAALPYPLVAPYDVLHAHFDMVPLGAAIHARRLQKPLVVDVEADWFDEMHLEGFGFHPLVERWGKWAQQRTLQQASAITFVSAESRDHFVQRWGLNPARLHVLPNGVDVELFAPHADAARDAYWRERLGLPAAAQIVLFVGGFARRHGIDQLIHAFAQVRKEVRDSYLVLIGDGDIQPELEQLVTDLGIGDGVIFGGRVSYRQVPELLRLADITASPVGEKYRDGDVQPLKTSPLKLLEYMAAETACVATASGQQRDFVADGETGLLVAPEDIEGFAAALIYLLQDKAARSRIAKNARSYVTAHHSWDRYAAQLRDIYAAVQSDDGSDQEQ